METGKRYEVAIVGGGIAGTTLALMCEKLRIDYILLEARDSLHADQGNGVVIQPNGLQILDQLGIADELMAEMTAIGTSYAYDGKGEVMNVNDVYKATEEIIGYPAIFAMRPALCRVLSGAISQKDSVKTACKVTSITEDDNEVVLTTSDGNSYRANVVVGADGIHSVVRSFIDRAATATGLPRSPDNYMSIPFSCCFGTSSPIPGIATGDRFNVYRQNTGVLGFSSKDGCVCWLIFEPCLDQDNKSIPYSQAPRFGKDNIDASLLSVQHLQVLPGVKLGDITANRITCFKLPLEEGVAQSWHTHRTVIVGDAAHKVSPCSGMGANLAIQSCAVLMNNLVEAKRQSPTGRLTCDALYTAWSRYSEVQKKASARWVYISNAMTQSLMCVPGKPLAAAEQLRDISDETYLDQLLNILVDAPILESVDVTERGKKFIAGMAVQKANKRRIADTAKATSQEDRGALSKL